MSHPSTASAHLDPAPRSDSSGGRLAGMVVGSPDCKGIVPGEETACPFSFSRFQKAEAFPTPCPKQAGALNGPAKPL